MRVAWVGIVVMMWVERALGVYGCSLNLMR
jgi:hypothetical protein